MHNSHTAPFLLQTVWPVNEWPKLPEGTQSNYMHMPVSLQIENAPYSEDVLRHRLEESAEHLDGTAKVIHDHPWRVVRWREVGAPDGTVHTQSNARIVTWSDGSQVSEWLWRIVVCCCCCWA